MPSEFASFDKFLVGAAAENAESIYHCGTRYNLHLRWALAVQSSSMTLSNASAAGMPRYLED